MIKQTTICRCDLCGEVTPSLHCYRVNCPAVGSTELVHESDGKIKWEQSSSTVVCYDCCKAIRKQTGGSGDV